MVLVHKFCLSKTPGECDEFNSEEDAESWWIRITQDIYDMLGWSTVANHLKKCVGTQGTQRLYTTNSVRPTLCKGTPPWSRCRSGAVWSHWRHSKCKRCKRRSCLGTCSKVKTKTGFSYDILWVFNVFAIRVCTHTHTQENTLRPSPCRAHTSGISEETSLHLFTITIKDNARVSH